MGLFDKKECALCGGKAGLLSRSEILGGSYICGDCRNRFSEHTTRVKQLSLEDIKDQIRIKEENDRRFENEFVTTRSFDFDSRHTMMLVDDNHGWFVIPKNKNTDIFSFDQIVSYNVDLNTEWLSEEDRRKMCERSGGSGLLGVLNFLLSDDFISRYPDLPHCPRDRKIIGMYFEIRFGDNPFLAEKISIDMLPGWSNNQTEIEKAYHCANDIYQCIKEYANGSRSVQNASVNTASVPQGSSSLQQIRELKELLDIGAITQEEFDAKKKQLLGL